MSRLFNKTFLKFTLGFLGILCIGFLTFLLIGYYEYLEAEKETAVPFQQDN
jgi:hypothetical protein